MTPSLRSPCALTALVVLALLVVTGCTAADGPAERDEVAVLCSNDAEICHAWAAAFTERSGIEVTTVRLPTSEALERIRRG